MVCVFEPPCNNDTAYWSWQITVLRDISEGN